ncbi:PH domain-containing protein [Nonomuraea sp. NN258]|uniref:PH domain-containing protein n=1 Tax=Nonomuraea antri TaxID=2730852 RepID=UPI001569965D|nr:PH domain-containing protein [Nonomuraea antri]NRQ40410.1 PH domain-containing protein [Nonomuraea antri]
MASMALVATGVWAFFTGANLDELDMRASVVSMFISAAGLLVGGASLVQQLRAERRQPSDLQRHDRSAEESYRHPSLTSKQEAGKMTEGEVASDMDPVTSDRPPRPLTELTAEGRSFPLRGRIKYGVHLLLGLLFPTAATWWVVAQPDIHRAVVLGAIFVGSPALASGLGGLLTTPHLLHVGADGIALVSGIRTVSFPWADLERVEWTSYGHEEKGGVLAAHPKPYSQIARSRPTAAYWESKEQAFILVTAVQLTRPIIDLSAAINEHMPDR